MCDVIVQEKTLSVQNEFGLHARPAAKIAKEAQKFSSAIRILMDDREIDAKSILDILSLAAPRGTALSLKAEGKDAAEAVHSIAELFAGRFGEDR